MNKIILILAVVILIFTPVFLKSKAAYESLHVQESLPKKIILAYPLTEAGLHEKAREYAYKYNVSHETMSRKVKCEAPIVEKDGVRYYDSEDPQSRIRYTADQIAKHPEWGEVGEREDSWGPAQIHLPDHPHITREQASDPDFALDFMAEHLSKGQDKWTCK